ncbi:Glycoside hydrolase family 61 protein [Ceratobasidium theobromae]|uniref:lytic cellulose monooxygenase (C4-dehydrogenating) n=1 Tax=Ceratobasidium theobromae TaxID=1582974 RepID=A0A5N5QRJ3_9AGAM|nr:Glycoside hydrolase family 61 protein [Ceratobasidium theobromae]
MLFPSLVSAFAFAAVANAHGYIKEITMDGKTYKGPVAGGAKIQSPIRQISDTNPWKDINGDGMTCGRNAQKAALVAPVTAGSTVELKWEDHPGDTWNHDTGPLMTYMAKVPDGQTADKFDPSKADFFKIAEAGQTGNTWVQASLMSDKAYKFTVPKGLEDGDYIIRHEIIALHLADKMNGAEFYINCAQVKVKGGTGNAKTAPSDVAHFPGTYSSKDKGIYTPTLYDGKFKYTFPGPKIATFADTGSGSGSTDPDRPVSEPSKPTSTRKTTTIHKTTKTRKPTPTEPVGHNEAPGVTEKPNTTVSAAPEPTEVDDCDDDDDEDDEDPKPSKSHKDRRTFPRVPSYKWMPRMEKQVVKAPHW